jgi:hypothetical protein
LGIRELMKPQKPAFYVYGYYDPRTLRLFYVGKGKGGRKAAHLAGTDPGAKSTTITAIHRAGLRPIIKVLASRLSEREALLVEKTMIWALGHQLTNRSSGQLADRFRPVDSLHSDLPGFDSNCGVYLVNVGEGPNRSWDDCRKYGFLAAGGGRNWSDQLERLSPGDIVVAYLKGHGYVGVARVLSPRVPVGTFAVRGKRLSPSMLAQPGLLRRADNARLSEYLVRVKWRVAVERTKARFQKNASLFTTQHVVASLAAQTRTLDYLEREFRLNFKRMLANA